MISLFVVGGFAQAHRRIIFLTRFIVVIEARDIIHRPSAGKSQFAVTGEDHRITVKIHFGSIENRTEDLWAVASAMRFNVRMATLVGCKSRKMRFWKSLCRH
jgi:hypothetical protein